ncbi:MAG: TetR/AcrR family transcriptional regulator [bacterium]|nr:TetR/AcrR family transcriptional regulator [bacterium]
MATAADNPTDGRVQRSERSREAIVRALLDLVGAGTLRPTAQQVAARADVGVRTVFRHFSDMDTLFAAMNERLTDEVRPFFVREAQTGSLDDRAAGLLAARFRILERAEPYMRSAALQRADSSFLQAQHDRTVRDLRTDLRRWLPELDDTPPAIADGLELALSFEAWDRLRTEQRLGVRRARESVARIVATLVAAMPSRD